MPRLKLACPPEAAFNEGFARIRAEFEIVVDFPPDVLADADRATPGDDRMDRRNLDLVAIDPPGSRDLDQAFTARRHGDGYLVHYAIADVGAFVRPSGALDLATQQRGLTFYAPDVNAPLHPEVLSAGAASLLPDKDTPALLWTLQLDARGRLVDADLERAVVRNRAARSYQEVADDLAREDPDPRHLLLREIGSLRLALEQDRGGVSLNLASQEVVDVGDHYEIMYRSVRSIEDWNAQLSLMTGMAAAKIMLDGKIGILRTLDPPTEGTLDWLRRTSNALSVSYPSAMSYPDWVRTLDSDRPIHAALRNQAARAFRAAGYVSFSGNLPEQPSHAALATEYAHVTAPLRRLVDRYANEIVVALCSGRRPAGWALEKLEVLPELMADAGRRKRAFERALVDFAEVMVLSCQVGRHFEAIVTDRRNGRVTLQLKEPAIIVRLRNTDLGLGDAVTVELIETDPVERRLDFAVV